MFLEQNRQKLTISSLEQLFPIYKTIIKCAYKDYTKDLQSAWYYKCPFFFKNNNLQSDIWSFLLLEIQSFAPFLVQAPFSSSQRLPWVITCQYPSQRHLALNIFKDASFPSLSLSAR